MADLFENPIGLDGFVPCTPLVGCANCFNTGYKGRMSIFEIMILNDNLKDLIVKTHDSNVIKKEAINQNMITLMKDGSSKVLAGLTTIEEIVRVSHV